MDAKYVTVLGLRIELEQAQVGDRVWWRGKVVGGCGWGAHVRMPWSYAPREEQATADAVVSWTRLHIPGPETG